MFLFFTVYVFFQTKLPVLENHLSITVRSLINTLNSHAPYARKVSHPASAAGEDFESANMCDLKSHICFFNMRLISISSIAA